MSDRFANGILYVSENTSDVGAIRDHAVLQLWRDVIIFHEFIRNLRRSFMFHKLK